MSRAMKGTARVVWYPTGILSVTSGLYLLNTLQICLQLVAKLALPILAPYEYSN